MKKIIDWFLKSNRHLHFAGGFIVGAGANDLYCAIYVGGCVSASLELKDYQWGGKPDILDFVMTVLGVAAGFGVRTLIKTLF